MGKSIPIQLEYYCNRCSTSFKEIRWYPDDHYKELSAIEMVRCKYCNNLAELIGHKQVNCKFIKKRNEIWLKVGDIKVPFLSLSSNNITLELGYFPNVFLGEIIISNVNFTLTSILIDKHGMRIE
jgi:DNA-directed RNA polymerase subunit RPC12/RpoP